jgi:hypothetical protein
MLGVNNYLINIFHEMVVFRNENSKIQRKVLFFCIGSMKNGQPCRNVTKEFGLMVVICGETQQTRPVRSDSSQSLCVAFLPLGTEKRHQLHDTLWEQRQKVKTDISGVWGLFSGKKNSGFSDLLL